MRFAARIRAVAEAVVKGNISIETFTVVLGALACGAFVTAFLIQ
jgi:hypothetical protein